MPVVESSRVTRVTALNTGLCRGGKWWGRNTEMCCCDVTYRPVAPGQRKSGWKCIRRDKGSHLCLSPPHVVLWNKPCKRAGPPASLSRLCDSPSCLHCVIVPRDRPHWHTCTHSLLSTDSGHSQTYWRLSGSVNNLWCHYQGLSVYEFNWTERF